MSGGTRWSEADLIAHQRRQDGATVKARAPSKMGNVPQVINGQRFASKLEANRYQELEQRQRLGLIRNLRAQVSFPLMLGEELIGSYVADAVYEDVQRGVKVVEDSKGRETPLFRWKARHFAAQYGFAITIVKRAKT